MAFKVFVTSWWPIIHIMPCFLTSLSVAQQLAMLASIVWNIQSPLFHLRGSVNPTLWDKDRFYWSTSVSTPLYNSTIFQPTWNWWIFHMSNILGLNIDSFRQGSLEHGHMHKGLDCTPSDQLQRNRGMIQLMCSLCISNLVLETSIKCFHPVRI